MISQLLKILWKQRKYNSLLMIELVLSFVALFVLAAVIIHYGKQYSEPLGMDYKNLWGITVRQDWNVPQEERISDSIKNIKFERIKDFIRQEPNVEAVAKTTFADIAYAQSRWASCFNFMDKQVCYDYSCGDADFAKAAGIEVYEGRWLTLEDELTETKTVVINERLKKELFGDKRAVGETITVNLKDKPFKVHIAGVMKHFKRQDFAEEKNFLIEALPGNSEYFPYDGMIIRLGVNASKNSEEQLVNNLNRFDKTFNYRMEKVEKMRNQYLRSALAPLVIAGFVIIFLIVNVMLGLFGTLWLNISRRKSEIGLRRAVGSSGKSILLQILGETYGLSAISMIIGFIFTSQIFIFNIYNTPVSTLVEANLLAFAIIMILCTISAYAPAKLAAKLEPATALHED